MIVFTSSSSCHLILCTSLMKEYNNINKDEFSFINEERIIYGSY